MSLILDGCIEPKNFCQILNFRLVGIGVFEGIKRYFVVNHATPETGARPITIILEKEWIRVRKSKNLIGSKIFHAKPFRIKCVNRDVLYSRQMCVKLVNFMCF